MAAILDNRDLTGNAQRSGERCAAIAILAEKKPERLNAAARVAGNPGRPPRAVTVTRREHQRAPLS